MFTARYVLQFHVLPTQCICVFFYGFQNTQHYFTIRHYITETEYVYCAVRAEALNTGCSRRNLAHFGKPIVRLNSIDITKNTYIRIWTLTGENGKVSFKEWDTLHIYWLPNMKRAIAYPGILFGGGGSTNSAEDRGHRERGSAGGSP